MLGVGLLPRLEATGWGGGLLLLQKWLVQTGPETNQKDLTGHELGLSMESSLWVRSWLFVFLVYLLLLAQAWAEGELSKGVASLMRAVSTPPESALYSQAGKCVCCASRINREPKFLLESHFFSV